MSVELILHLSETQVYREKTQHKRIRTYKFWLVFLDLRLITVISI